MDKFTLGIDFGGVLSVNDKADAEHRNIEIDMPGALENLKKLKEANYRLVLISFAGRKRALETRDSIVETCPDIFDTMYFVKHIKYKVDICKYEGCDAMIDDREVVLEYFKGSPTIPILFTSWENFFLPMFSLKVSPYRNINTSKMTYN